MNVAYFFAHSSIKMIVHFEQMVKNKKKCRQFSSKCRTIDKINLSQLIHRTMGVDCEYVPLKNEEMSNLWRLFLY